MVDEGTAGWPRDTRAVVGSSLGGYYASVVAERHGGRCVVINPAVEPARDLARYVGELTAFHDPTQRFEFRTEYLDELRAMRPSAPAHPERTLAIIAKGDEVLDWQEMVARYPAAQQTLLEGGDHALSDFEDHLPAVAQFLQLA